MAKPSVSTNSLDFLIEIMQRKINQQQKSKSTSSHISLKDPASTKYTRTIGRGEDTHEPFVSKGKQVEAFANQEKGLLLERSFSS